MSVGTPLPVGPPVSEVENAAETTPIRRRLATLFVDIAGSTSLLVHHAPEVILGVVQGFMGLVTDVASAYAGRVKDYEGDGALLYFASTKNAVRAALAVQKSDSRMGTATSRVETAPESPRA